MRTRQMTLGPQGITPMVKYLLIANGAVFLVQLLSEVMFPAMSRFIWAYFPLRPADLVEYGFAWQLITYQFMHANFFHILFNMFILWMFGTELERVWDTDGFLRFYIVCGIAAGVTMTIFNYSRIPVIGASGAVMGLLGAFAYLWPNREVYVWGIFPIKIKYFVLFIGGTELLMGMSELQTGFAHAAHLGGLAMGLIYLRFDDPRRSLLRPFQKWLKKKKVEQKRKQWEEQQRKRDEMVKEADEILDKLRKLSWEELSESEKRRIKEISDELDEVN